MNRRACRRRAGEGGVAAMELLFVLLVTVTCLLPALLFFGRLTWYAVATQKGVSSAARMLSALPPERITGDNAAAYTITSGDAHVRLYLRSAGLDIQPSAMSINVLCTSPNGQTPCGDPELTAVRISAPLRFRDTIFQDGSTSSWLTTRIGNQVYDQTVNYAP